MSRALLLERLQAGVTTVCRAWRLERADGVVMGFTDHDRDLVLDGLTYLAGSGITARALVQTSGLSVDNSEAMGALSAAAITEADIRAGRYDNAQVRLWLVDWSLPEARMEQFRGSLGEITRAGGAWQGELRGLGAALNQPQGRVMAARCGAVLGDGACGVDLGRAELGLEVLAEAVEEGTRFAFADLASHPDRWFERGLLRVLEGPAAGLSGRIKTDRLSGAGRVLGLWRGLGADVAPGVRLRLEAGCDKRLETCRLKFDNVINFQGFPHVPGEDWILVSPARAR